MGQSRNEKTTGDGPVNMTDRHYGTMEFLVHGRRDMDKGTHLLFCTYYLHLQYTRYWIEIERDLTFIIFQSSIQTGRKSYLHIEWKHRWIWMDLLYLIFTHCLIYLIFISIFRVSWPWHFQQLISPRPSFKSQVPIPRKSQILKSKASVFKNRLMHEWFLTAKDLPLWTASLVLHYIGHSGSHPPCI